MDKRYIKTGALTEKQLGHHLYLEQKNNDSGKFMKIRRVIIPTLTLIAIMASSVPSAFAMTPVEATDLLDGSEMVVMEMADVDAITSASPSYTSDGQRIVYASNNSVEVSTVDKSVLGKDFTDLTGYWGADAVKFCADRGIASGYPDGTFKPNNNITRSEFTALVVRAFDPDGSKTNEALQSAETEGTMTLEQAQSKGFTWDSNIMVAADYYGVGRVANLTKTDWEKNISRDEMAFIAMNLALTMDGQKFEVTTGIEGAITDYTPTVRDNQYVNAIKQAYSNGILSGDQNHNYNPSNPATRGESCAIISRLIDSSKRADVEINVGVDINGPTGQVSDQVQSTTINQSDPFRRSVKEGDTFVTSSGEKIVVKKDPVSGTYNPADPVGFDLGRSNGSSGVVTVNMDSDGNDGGQLGSIYYKAPNGHMGWTEEFVAIMNSGYDKPSTPGTKNGQLSPQKYWVWLDNSSFGLPSEWSFNMNLS